MTKPKPGFQPHLLTVVFVFSILTIILDGAAIWRTHLHNEEITKKYIALTQNIGRIMLMDEVLTMSARMTAATGDMSYERRYDQFDPQLTAAINATRDMLPQADLARFVGETDAANDALVKMERQAFALVHQGNSQEAMALLTSVEYARQKAVYNDGMTMTRQAADALIEREDRQQHRLALWLTLLNSLMALGLLVGWFVARRTVRRWEMGRGQAMLLEQRTRLLEQSNRGKDEFLAAISHELKTPLNHILGFSGMLKEGLAGELNAEQKGMAQDIFDAGSKLLAIVKSLIELARLQAGKVKLQAEPEDPAELLGEIAARHATKAGAAGLAFNVEVAQGLGEMPLDREAVTRLLDQLLDNAFKFTPSGGKVSIKARRVPRADVTAPVRSEAGEYLELAVADNGPGIAPEILPRLFHPFVQGDGSLARRHGGTGIGLALVRLLAELHGGGCGVESVPGAGAKFLVWLPCGAVEACG